MNTVAPQKRLVLGSLALMAIAFTMAVAINRTKLPDAIAINTEGQPTIGYSKARVHVVIFEEPKCTNCKIFNDKIFPSLKTNFIDTNKILFTAIPVSFLPNSMTAASSLLCVYQQDEGYPNSELFFTFLDYIYRHQPPEHVDWATLDNVIKMASNASPAINIEHLKNCGEQEVHRIEIAKNTKYAAQLMGGAIGTPTIYVNGIEVKELSYHNIKNLINLLLKKEGIQ